ncbi:hypothetical protein PFBG_02953 [Plasmodium falciparum 7G8]|uniref:Uncharacterized protein n=2 Tax=Plasmodium falciparum TaxID=5833 RepID=A0A024V5R4_PLAFA|nr:hypothetical protein PFFVO_02874 [Plasmodium falciparum Vietnam Oak-Knoll (FVO)]EUR71927.1 hypothetical protein PFBG_02953 [Plasmodium falciparum 7G8]
MDKLALEAFYVKKRKSFKNIYYKLQSLIMLTKENKRTNKMGRSFEDTLLAMLFLSSNYYIMNNNNIFLKYLNKYYKGIKKVKLQTKKYKAEVYKVLLKRISYTIYNIFLKTMKNKERKDTPDIKYTLYNIDKNKNIQEEYLCNIFDKYFKPLFSYIALYKGSLLIMEFYNIRYIFNKQIKFFTKIKKNNKHIIYDTFFL